ncbi:uncharacterized protein LOC144094462 [Amblyomma americanum]
MEAAMADRGGPSPRLLLWNSIARTAKGAFASLVNAEHGCFPDEAQTYRGNQEYPRGCNGVRCLLEEDARRRDVEEGPGPSVPLHRTAVPRTVSTLVALAHRRQPASLACRARNEWADATAEIVVGTDGLVSASVAGSLRCLHVRLRGLHILQRYFVAVDVQLDGERGDPYRSESASYLVPKPNLLDGLGWAHSPLTLDLAPVLRERSQRTSLPMHAARQWDIRYRVTARILPLAEDCWPSGEEPVLILLKEGSLHEVLSGKGMSRPGTIPPDIQDLTYPQGSLWKAGALQLPLSARSPPTCCGRRPFEQERPLPCSWDRNRDVRAALACCQDSSLWAPTAAACRCWEQSPAPHDVEAPRGRAVFYRDLDAEAALRLQHLELQQASSGEASQQRWSNSDEDKLLQFRAGSYEDTPAKWAEKSDSFNTVFKF